MARKSPSAERARLIASLEESHRTGARATTPHPKLTVREATAPSAVTYSPSRVKKLRATMRVSQAVFAELLNVSPETVRSWEQGKRVPEGAARRLLEVTERRPEIVASMLEARGGGA